MARGTTRGIHRRPDQHHRPDQARPPNGELGHDLAAHRIGHEQWRFHVARLEPAAERVGHLPDAERPARLTAPSLAR